MVFPSGFQPRDALMVDDYQYKALNLPIKNEGLFGLSGNPNKNGIGYSGKIINSYSGQSSGGIGRDGSIGPEGATGATGASGPPPSNIDNIGMLYYNGEKWTTKEFPSTPFPAYIGRFILTFTPQEQLFYEPAFLGAGVFGLSSSWDLIGSRKNSVIVSDGGTIRDMLVFKCECTNG